MTTQTFLSPVLLTIAVAFALPACDKSDKSMEKSTEMTDKKVEGKKDMLKPEMDDKKMGDKKDMAEKEDMDDMDDNEDMADKKKMDDKEMDDDKEEDDDEGGW